MSTDFQCEYKLKELNPYYSKLISNAAFVMSGILDKYVSYFPTYTDHSALHSLQVIDFCNRLIGKQIELMNEDEILVLLFSCYLHDTGMGISDKDYKAFRDKVVSEEYVKAHPGESIQEQIRNFHHEFSGRFIKKYAPLFEIPSDEHLFAIIQVSRGHRRTELFDPAEYPADFKVPGGNTVCLPYLAALIRLADEMDIASDRNIFFDYSNKSVLDYVKHASITHMEVRENSFDLTLKKQEDKQAEEFIMHEIGKLQDTLDYCKRVCEERTKYRISQSKVNIIPAE